ncbi:MAG: helix-turn-helix transcriptional regulator [Planctomycetes bacterium]|nr:helix-turn-helix transcriptional regulator [Planctomycetota bacterium]
MRSGAYSTPVSTTTLPGPERLIRAFAEPTRLRLLALLLEGEICVCDLTRALGVPQPTASRHLANLRRAGWVRVRKDGLWCHYSLAPATGPVHASLLECLAQCRAEMPELESNEARCKAARAERCC